MNRTIPLIIKIMWVNAQQNKIKLFMLLKGHSHHYRLSAACKWSLKPSSSIPSCCRSHWICLLLPWPTWGLQLQTTYTSWILHLIQSHAYYMLHMLFDSIDQTVTQDVKGLQKTASMCYFLLCSSHPQLQCCPIRDKLTTSMVPRLINMNCYAWCSRPLPNC